MCGIAGFNWGDERLVTALTDLLAHRGPDQSGVYTDERVSIGHRRLSILDLSERGSQPMGNEDGAVMITFNGEIFNYRELRAALIEKGHLFISETDTEVLVHLYEERGPDMLSELNGQFAFCVYDSNRGSLFLARDRAGILPLYYYDHEGRFIFASELKSIIGSGVAGEIDGGAVEEYFRRGYIAAPNCILKGARKLEPAHYIIYDLKGGKVERHERYWDAAFDDSISDEREAAARLRRELERSVGMRLMADVPVGAFLSGGIDSSAVVAITAKKIPGLKTFSVRFDSADCDEGACARRAAECFGTEHHEIAFSANEVRRCLPELVEHYDEPFADPSALPTYLISKAARGFVTVCLSGDGADELLAGYDRYRYFCIARVLNRLPKPVKSALEKVLGLVNRLFPKFALERCMAVLMCERLGDTELYDTMCEKLPRRDLMRLFKGRAGRDIPRHAAGEGTWLASVQRHDMTNYLEGDILAKVDRAAMASGLETRPPFLDHRLIEVCCRMQPCLKIRAGQGKWILRKAFAGILPAGILRKRKHGFHVPLRRYLAGDLRDLVKRYVSEYEGHDLFDREFLRDIVSGKERRDATRLSWMVMMFNMWHERWIRGCRHESRIHSDENACV